MNVPAGAPATGPDAVPPIRRAFRDRRVLLAVAGLTVGAAGALDWSWLAAIGLAPVILSALPCVAMCALGLCMNRMGGSCERKTGTASHRDAESAPAVAEEAAEAPSSRRSAS